MRRIGFFALMFGLGLSAASAQSFTPDPVDKAAAVKEGTLTWYSSTPFPLVQQLADQFTKDTGVKVTLLRSGGEAVDRKSTRLNSSHVSESRMPSSA